MNYNLSKNLNIQLHDVNKFFYTDFFKCTLNLIKEIFSTHTYFTVSIFINTNDNFSINFSSIDQFEKEYTNSTGIKSCEFYVFPYPTSDPQTLDASIRFKFGQNSLYNMELLEISANTSSKIATEDCILKIEKHIKSLFPDNDTSFKPIPIELTTSNNERIYQETASKFDQRVSLKHALFITIFGCTLTFVFGYFSALLTQSRP